MYKKPGAEYPTEFNPNGIAWEEFLYREKFFHDHDGHLKCELYRTYLKDNSKWLTLKMVSTGSLQLSRLLVYQDTPEEKDILHQVMVAHILLFQGKGSYPALPSRIDYPPPNVTYTDTHKFF